MTVVVAAFDWDGTLTRRDCVMPFLLEIAGPWAMMRHVVADPVGLIGAVVRRDRDRLKQWGVAGAFRNRSVADVAERGRRFAERVLDGWLRPDTLARLRWHQAVGHHVVIVSASLAPYLEPLGEYLGIDTVLCTRLVHVDGRYTGDLEGPNCRGVHKVERLDGWRRDQPHEVVVEWAYGDSRGDDAMLATARHGVRVGRVRLAAVPASPMTHS